MLILRVEVVGWTCELEPPDEEIVMTGVLADMLPTSVCLHVSDRDGNIVMSMHMIKGWKRTRLGRVATPLPRSRVLYSAHPSHATFFSHHNNINETIINAMPSSRFQCECLEDKGHLLRMPWMRPDFGFEMTSKPPRSHLAASLHAQCASSKGSHICSQGSPAVQPIL